MVRRGRKEVEDVSTAGFPPAWRVSVCVASRTGRHATMATATLAPAPYPLPGKQRKLFVQTSNGAVVQCEARGTPTPAFPRLPRGLPITRRSLTEKRAQLDTGHIRE